MANSFIQGEELFSYVGTSCIRNDYYHNDCQRCVDICPEGAFHIVRNKLTLFDNECIACGACVGSCPSEALHVKGFDPNAFAWEFAASSIDALTCKGNTSCLAAFDQHHFISMGLQKSYACELSHCEGCNVNKEGRIEALIRSNITKANRFFEQCSLECHVAIRDDSEAVSEKRALFRSALHKAKANFEEKDETHEAMTRAHQKERTVQEPLKHRHLKHFIKEAISKCTQTRFEEQSELFFEKAITFEACTNCGDCIQFCPTAALQATPDSQGIVFTAGQCIGCGICDHICKTDAIHTKAGVDLVNVVYDRSEVLAHYEMVMCQECRCPYPYRGGEPICDRCALFKNDFGGMFTLARDL